MLLSAQVAYLLIYGALPEKKQLSYFTSRVMRHTFVHEQLKTMMKSFRYDAHPMGWAPPPPPPLVVRVRVGAGVRNDRMQLEMHMAWRGGCAAVHHAHVPLCSGMFISTVTAMSTFHPEANPALAGQEIYASKEV